MCSAHTLFYLRMWYAVQTLDVIRNKTDGLRSQTSGWKRHTSLLIDRSEEAVFCCVTVRPIICFISVFFSALRCQFVSQCLVACFSYIKKKTIQIDTLVRFTTIVHNSFFSGRKTAKQTYVLAVSRNTECTCSHTKVSPFGSHAVNVQ